MEKIRFNDGTEFNIKDGARLDNVVLLLPDFASLEEVADALTTNGNIETVQFLTNDNVSGEYSKIALITPLFQSVDLVDGMVEASIFFRQKTDLEIAIEELKAGQEVQDGAIVELAEILGGE